MALSLQDISFAYDAGTPMEQPALRGVSLEVERGSIALVLGPTGSGKSTLLRIAAGLLVPGSGDIHVDGEPLAGISASRSGHVGIVFQNPETQLFAETVLDDVAFGPRNQGLAEDAAREQARRALGDVGLDSATFGGRSPLALSGGEARRVALAGVLAMRPRYLLLDEPTAGLDAGGRRDVRRVLSSLRETTGLVIVTHDAEEFLGRADQALVLAAGQSAYSGAAAELVARPSVLAEAGLRPPAVLETLVYARAHGAEIPSLTVDPTEAAEILVRAKGVVV